MFGEKWTNNSGRGLKIVIDKLTVLEKKSRRRWEGNTSMFKKLVRNQLDLAQDGDY